MHLREIMTRAVETIGADASLRLAASKMESENVGFLPVMRNGQLVGVITDRDITIRAVSKGLNPEQTRVEAAMTGEIVAMQEDCDLEDAADLMEQQNVRRLIVTGEDDSLIGVVSMDRVALFIGFSGLEDEDGLSTEEIQGKGFQGEAVAGTREFPEDFDPAEQAYGGETETSIGTGDNGVGDDNGAQDTGSRNNPASTRTARDQTDPPLNRSMDRRF